MLLFERFWVESAVAGRLKLPFSTEREAREFVKDRGEIAPQERWRIVKEAQEVLEA